MRVGREALLTFSYVLMFLVEDVPGLPEARHSGANLGFGMTGYCSSDLVLRGVGAAMLMSHAGSTTVVDHSKHCDADSSNKCNGPSSASSLKRKKKRDGKSQKKSKRKKRKREGQSEREEFGFG